MRMPDLYEASARIYVDTQSVLKPLMQGLAVQPNVDQQVMILSRTLISRPNVEKLVRMADLDLDAKTKADQDANDRRADEGAQDRAAPAATTSTRSSIATRSPRRPSASCSR